ncbi:MAG: hypothetical protein IT350_11690, partial [Deltaproteobacteria bacterium]|nr:hypothetical protein [Deltaproteobacteria bacterium]
MSLSPRYVWACLVACWLIGLTSPVGADESDPLSPYVVDGLWCPSEITVWAGYSCAYNEQCPKLRLRVADGDQDLAGG